MGLKMADRGFDLPERAPVPTGVPIGRIPDEPYFRWIQWKLEKHPIALGGEPCCYCGSPIDETAKRIHRQRHVCGAKCNRLILDRLKRRAEKGKEEPYDVASLNWPDVVDELCRPNRVFKTDFGAEFPFEHGRWAKAGDVVERFGHHTEYFSVQEIDHLAAELRNIALQLDPELRRIVGLRHKETGCESFMVTDAAGRPTRLKIQVSCEGMQLETAGVFLHQEKILSVDDLGIPFLWWVPVFTPFPLGKMYSSKRLSYNESSARAHKARSAYRARLKSMGVSEADADFVDPQFVYDAAKWMCGICSKKIDSSLKWPNPFAATLDHKIPITKGGTHDESNLQPAHLACNLRKGNS